LRLTKLRAEKTGNKNIEKFMEVMGNQYERVKKNYGIDEALAESSESEADEYIRKLAH
jgi:hypothetical protein